MPNTQLGETLETLYAVIQQRQQERPPDSYTTYLFEKGLDKILKKVGEEATETIIAAKNHGTAELTAEISDLLYHLLVLMVEKEVSLVAVREVLAQRAGKPAEAKYSQ
jgi:phosphoribosyl-ATP pyrophosphohydrolase/phosphoribosyl-AMP cyclohydrolase